jgi:hypothetical protein
MTEKTAPPSRHPESVLKVVRLIVDGQRTRAIWHRFFGITSLLIETTSSAAPRNRGTLLDWRSNTFMAQS